MKILLFLFFIPFSTYAKQFCQINENCTEKMKAISENFEKGSSNFIQNKVVAYSGECFHQTWMYDPNHAHHAVFVFYPGSNSFKSFGELSFFSENNPYKEMSTSQLIKKMSYQEPGFSVIENGSLVLRFIFPEAQLEYFFRSSVDNSQLSVVHINRSTNYFGRAFCTLQKHN